MISQYLHLHKTIVEYPGSPKYCMEFTENIKEIRLKEMKSKTVGDLLWSLHLVACMEFNNWMMNWCLFLYVITFKYIDIFPENEP